MLLLWHSLLTSALLVGMREPLGLVSLNLCTGEASSVEQSFWEARGFFRGPLIRGATRSTALGGLRLLLKRRGARTWKWRKQHHHRHHHHRHKSSSDVSNIIKSRIPSSSGIDTFLLHYHSEARAASATAAPPQVAAAAKTILPADPAYLIDNF